MSKNQRIRITVRGAVQGVGFRPFIYRLATDLRLTGWVSNSAQGVSIEAEGSQQQLEIFLLRIQQEKPAQSSIQSLEFAFLDSVGYTTFAIRPGGESGDKTAQILPDIATCADCLREIFDPKNRRYLYPFTNCTHCGPRFTILKSLPYDRANTTMKGFKMCSECQQEYENPLDRRFHAQPNACADCGPHVELWDQTGKILISGVRGYRYAPLFKAAEAIRAGQIMAVKGLGGFHLVVDARNENAITRLRKQKHREEKPFAVVFPSLELAKIYCEISELEERLLLSPESPIVLLRRKDFTGVWGYGSVGVWEYERSSYPHTPTLPYTSTPPHLPIHPLVAPGNPCLGVMLPYTPLHYILMKELGFPIVATSGNLSDEPLCIDEFEAVERLRGIADLFLVHNRPIVQHVDDSVVRVMMGREFVLRRARGYAPAPLLSLESGVRTTSVAILALGGHLKNTVATITGNSVFVSQHIGDLQTKQAFDTFQRTIESFRQLWTHPNLHNVHRQRIVCDLHPEYVSSKYARQSGAPLITVQHHHAHVVSCMADNALRGRVLGFSWDGAGYGPDGTIWGGEFLLATEVSFSRIGHFRAFRLPGGEKAIKEPRRAAIGVLYELFGENLFKMNHLLPVQAFLELPGRQDYKEYEEQINSTRSPLVVIERMLAKGLNTPLTSSAGRLFDAIASLVGLRQCVSFEGQAAMELEFAMKGRQTEADYPFQILDSKSSIIIDWEPMIREILDDIQQAFSALHFLSSASIGKISAKFHNTLVEIMVAVAKRVGEERVLLTGGCFQNKYLTERAVHRLKAEGFCPYWHQRVPPNDGGIAFGQAIVAYYRDE